MVRIENGRLQSLEASEAQSQMQLVVPATTITTTNTTTICHKHKSELQLAPNVCCGLRVFRATCGLWQTAATYVSGCLPACLPACHDSHVSHWGRICHQPCGGAAALKKCTHNLAFNRAEKKNYKIVFMLRLFYSRFNTLERTGYYGSVMEWVDNSNNSYIGKAELLMSIYFRKFLKVHTKHVIYIFLLFFPGYVTVGTVALITLLALVFYKLLFLFLFFVLYTR